MNICNNIMTIDVQIKVGKLQFNIDREAAKIAPLSSDKINKNKYLTNLLNKPE